MVTLGDLFVSGDDEVVSHGLHKLLLLVQLVSAVQPILVSSQSVLCSELAHDALVLADFAS